VVFLLGARVGIRSGGCPLTADTELSCYTVEEADANTRPRRTMAAVERCLWSSPV